MMILQQTRGALSSGDRLALDLPFAATKSLAARIGPTPTFTRGSGATYVGSDGLIHGVDTSTTSNTIGTGSKTFTLAATAGQDQLYRTGDAVDASNGSNSMVGTVTSYDATTQVLVCNITSVTGSGTFSSWRIGYRGPRFDHNPANPSVCRGLLIEEGRTNLILHSANFKNTTSPGYWENLSATTVTVDQIASPDGGVNADLLTTSTTSFDCFARRTGIFTGSTQYTYSIFLKQGPSTHRYVGLYIGAGVSALKFPFFDFNNPTTVQIPSGTMVGTINSTRVDAYPNGWYRVSITFTTAATPVTTYCGVYISQSDGTIPASSAAGLDCYIWGIQAETGAFPTSYIPTTTSTLARAADTCNITGGAFNSFYNQSEGTLFADVSGLIDTTIGGSRQFVVFSDNTYANTIGISKQSGTAFLQANARVGNVNQFTLSNAYVPFTRYKIAIGIKANDANAAFNGSLGTTVTSVTMPSTISELELRDPTGAAAGHPTCHIVAIRYYRKRLVNAKLITLTA